LAPTQFVEWLHAPPIYKILQANKATGASQSIPEEIFSESNEPAASRLVQPLDPSSEIAICAHSHWAERDRQGYVS